MALVGGGDLKNAARGFLMGGADIIPGVSGGTIALILGIYERLITAISRFDLELLGHLRRGRVAAAAEHVDLRFLITLFVGIGAGIVGLASLMHHLLDHHLQHTLGAFFGMILASSLLVGRMVDRWRGATIGTLVAGFAFAFWLVGLPFLESPPDSLLYILLCGSIAICAMILPGISGAFILLIMGKYFDVTGIIKGLPKGEVDGDGLALVAMFACGAAVGLLSFSKLLHWLLDRYHALTMATLCGFMMGSLRKIWPFKTDLTPTETEFKLKQFENTLPDFGAAPSPLVSIGVLIIAGALVLALDRLSGSDEGEAA